MNDITRYMDRYYLDAIIGIIPGWGDIITIFCAVPFIYFSTRVIKSIPLTLAIINNALSDVLLGMIPFFVGDIIDIYATTSLDCDPTLRRICRILVVRTESAVAYRLG